MPNLDVELASQPATPARGFALVASKFASDSDSDSDKTTTIYRRFDELSARNLLFYQAELAELEGQQRDYDEIDRNAKDQVSIECQRDWSEFEKHASEDENGIVQRREKEKMELAMKIREKLEKYHAPLAAHQLLLNSQPPSNSTIKAMRDWFFNNTAGKPGVDEIPQLWGASETIFDDPHNLVALRISAD